MNANNIWMDFIINDDEKIWFSSGANNALFCYDGIEKQLHFVDHFPDERINTFRLYSSGIKYDKKLIFGPFHAKSIAIYDKIEKKFTMIPVETSLSGKIPFCNIFSWKEYIYFVATGVKQVILKLDMKTYAVNVLEYEIGQMAVSPDFMCRELTLVENTLFCAFFSVSKILEFDLEKDIFVEHTISKGNGFGTIAHQGDALWLSEQNKIIKWSYLDHTIEEYYEFPDDYGMQVFSDNQYLGLKKGFQDQFSKWHQPFFRSTIVDNKLFLLSAEMNMSLLVDTNTGQIDKCYILEEESLNRKHINRISVLKYLFINTYDNGFIFYSNRDNHLYSIKRYFRQIEKIDMQLDEDEMWEYSQIINEEEYQNIYVLLRHIYKNYKAQNQELQYNNQYGRLIYNELKRGV